MSSFDLSLAIESFPFILKGLQYTLLVAFISMGLALILGLFFSSWKNVFTNLSALALYAVHFV